MRVVYIFDKNFKKGEIIMAVVSGATIIDHIASNLESALEGPRFGRSKSNQTGFPAPKSPVPRHLSEQ